MKINFFGFLLVVFILIISNCAIQDIDEIKVNEDDSYLQSLLNEEVQNSKGSNGTNDPAEGSDPDFRRLYIVYNDYNIYIYHYFYNPVNLQWGDPYTYLYDKIDLNDKDMIIFPSSNSYEIRRDRDNNGHFETLVASGSSVYTYSGGGLYVLVIPRGYMPDIGSRKFWSYCMTSLDRVPDNGNLDFNENISKTVTDPQEGTDPDFCELEVGYDKSLIYIELDYYNAVSSLSWGYPYIYLYDQRISSERYMIAFTSSKSYEIRQDKDANGHFETFVYAGRTVYSLDKQKRYTLTIPCEIIPNISNKKIWAYSMDSTDRIPDSGYLTF